MASETAIPDTALADGTLVKDRWRVLSKLGEGGFGAVYKVQDMSSKEEYAMKVESKKEEDSMIHIEAIILKLLSNRKLLRHACQYIDEGDTPTYRYLIMQLLGRSVSEIRKAAKDQRFSLSTTIRIGMQCLEGIETLHKIGFLHRDVKPGNFAMGRNETDKRTVFLLDFGLCRQYIARDGQLRPARKAAGFRGTVRYASINTHLRKELGRHDDLWSLYYMMIEMRTGDLPWRRTGDKDAVLKKKQETTLDELLHCIKEPEFVRMNETLRKLEYKDTPNYVWFHLQLKAILMRNHFADADPFDWEPGGESYETCCNPRPAKPKRKKAGKCDRTPNKEKDGTGCEPQVDKK